MSEANAAYSRPVATTVFFDPQRASEAEWRDALAYWRQRSAEDFPDEPLASDAETRHGVLQSAPLYVIHRVLALEFRARGEVRGLAEQRVLVRVRRNARHRIHRRCGRSDHRLPVRARPRHADGADGRDRPRGAARHPDPRP